MRVLKFVLIICLCTAFAGLATASNQEPQRTDPTTIFLTTATGNQILKINTATTPATVVQTYSDRRFVPEDLTIGPDNKLYVCSPTTNEIRRMNQDFSGVQTVYSGGASGPLFFPEGPKFDAFGDLLVNSRGSSSGVWIFPHLAGGTPTAPTRILSFTETGEGLAFSNDGQLRIVDQTGGTVSSVAPNCYVSPFGCSVGTPLISGLNAPTGIARDNFDNIYVAQTGAGLISKFNPDGSSAGTYATFPSPDQPWFIKFAADGALFVATSQLGGTQTGKLYLVPPGGGSATLLFSVPPPNPTKPAPPAIGVALGATNFTIKATSFASGLPSTGFELVANFGHDGVQVIELSGNCTVPITVTQKTPAAVNAALAATVGSSFTANQEPGQEGWTNTFAVPSNAATLCGSILSPQFYKMYLFAFMSNPSFINPQIIKCDLSGNNDGNMIPVSGAPPAGLSCAPMTNFGFYPFGILPHDPASGGGGGTWSEYIYASQAPAAGQTDQFCGFDAPLAGTTITNPDVIQGNNSGIPVKFHAGTCPSGPFDTNLTATVSAQLLSGATFTPILINPEGSSNSELPPIFRPDGAGGWIFNLKFVWPDGTRWSPGEYAITVTSDKFAPQTAFIQLQ
jgi:hypothetical protein